MLSSRLVLSTSEPLSTSDRPSILTLRLQHTLWPALPPAPVTSTLFIDSPCAGVQLSEQLISREVKPRTTNSSSANGLRSEEHTSELQSQSNLVCRLLLEKKKRRTRH